MNPFSNFRGTALTAYTLNTVVDRNLNTKGNSNYQSRLNSMLSIGGMKSFEQRKEDLIHTNKVPVIPIVDLVKEEGILKKEKERERGPELDVGISHFDLDVFDYVSEDEGTILSKDEFDDDDILIEDGDELTLDATDSGFEVRVDDLHDIELVDGDELVLELLDKEEIEVEDKKGKVGLGSKDKGKSYRKKSEYFDKLGEGKQAYEYLNNNFSKYINETQIQGAEKFFGSRYDEFKKKALKSKSLGDLLKRNKISGSQSLFKGSKGQEMKEIIMKSGVKFLINYGCWSDDISGRLGDIAVFNYDIKERNVRNFKLISDNMFNSFKEKDRTGILLSNVLHHINLNSDEGRNSINSLNFSGCKYIFVRDFECNNEKDKFFATLYDYSWGLEEDGSMDYVEMLSQQQILACFKDYNLLYVKVAAGRVNLILELKVEKVNVKKMLARKNDELRKGQVADMMDYLEKGASSDIMINGDVYEFRKGQEFNKCKHISTSCKHAQGGVKNHSFESAEHMEYTKCFGVHNGQIKLAIWLLECYEKVKGKIPKVDKYYIVYAGCGTLTKGHMTYDVLFKLLKDDPKLNLILIDKVYVGDFGKFNDRVYPYVHYLDLELLDVIIKAHNLEMNYFAYITDIRRDYDTKLGNTERAKIIEEDNALEMTLFEVYRKLRIVLGSYKFNIPWDKEGDSKFMYIKFDTIESQAFITSELRGYVTNFKRTIKYQNYDWRDLDTKNSGFNNKLRYSGAVCLDCTKFRKLNKFFKQKQEAIEDTDW